MMDRCMVPSQDATQGTAREGMPVLSVGSRLTSRWATSKLCTTRGGYRVPATMHTATFTFLRCATSCEVRWPREVCPARRVPLHDRGVLLPRRDYPQTKNTRIGLS